LEKAKNRSPKAKYDFSTLSIVTLAEAYQILELMDGADNPSIKKAFRNKALLLHPDRNQDKNTHHEFIQVVEAYELILNNKKKPKSKLQYSEASKPNTDKQKPQSFRNSSHQHQHYYNPNGDKEYQQRFENAKKRFAEEEESKSKQIYQKNLEEYQKGKGRKIAILIAGFSCILAILFTLDRTLPQTISPLSSEEAQIYLIADYNQVNYLYLVKETRFIITKEQMYSISQSKEIFVEQTPIFGDVLKVFNTNQHDQNQDFNLRTSWDIFHTYPLILLFLLFPLLSFALEKPSFSFVFYFIYYNLYALPLIILFLFFHHNRFGRMLEMIF
jgi:hypothetical protein